MEVFFIGNIETCDGNPPITSVGTLFLIAFVNSGFFTFRKSSICVIFSLASALVGILAIFLAN